jgi:hypothetical protein
MATGPPQYTAEFDELVSASQPVLPSKFEIACATWNQFTSLLCLGYEAKDERRVEVIPSSSLHPSVAVL